GGNVKGGKMYGDWKGLATEALDNGVDLAVTTDYRTILQEIITKRMGAGASLGYILPGFESTKTLGFI
ncbi:hypothetical protein ABTM39_19885, partial [Acinetobacter baumannii]